jgi:hypothetical protein
MDEGFYASQDTPEVARNLSQNRFDIMPVSEASELFSLSESSRSELGSLHEQSTPVKIAVKSDDQQFTVSCLIKLGTFVSIPYLGIRPGLRVDPPGN